MMWMSLLVIYLNSRYVNQLCLYATGLGSCHMSSSMKPSIFKHNRDTACSKIATCITIKYSNDYSDLFSSPPMWLDFVNMSTMLSIDKIRQATYRCIDMFHYASLALQSKLVQLLHQSGSQSCKCYPFLPFVWISCASLCANCVSWDQVR